MKNNFDKLYNDNPSPRLKTYDMSRKSILHAISMKQKNISRYAEDLDDEVLHYLNDALSKLSNECAVIIYDLKK